MIINSLNDIIGNEGTIRLLKSVIAKKDSNFLLPKSYIIGGPSGSGKSVLAKVFLKEMGLDPKKVSPRSYNSVPNWDDPGSYPCLIFENAENISKTLWEILVERIDTINNQTIFIFVTQFPFSLPSSIKSRSLEVMMKAPTDAQIAGYLSNICATNGLNYELAAINQLAHYSKGNLKVALNNLLKCELMEEVTTKSVEQVLDLSLEEASHKIIQALSLNQLAESQKILSGLTFEFSSQNIIDTLFTVYASLYLSDKDVLSKKLRNLPKVVEVFIKWKSGIQISREQLPLLLIELWEAGSVYSHEVRAEEFNSELVTSAAELCKVLGTGEVEK